MYVVPNFSILIYIEKKLRSLCPESVDDNSSHYDAQLGQSETDNVGQPFRISKAIIRQVTSHRLVGIAFLTNHTGLRTLSSKFGL